MSAKRKLFVSLFSIVFVVFAVITTFAAVYGLTEQDVVSMIDIGYTAEDIDGYVEATYTVGNVENYLTPVGNSVDGNKLVFNAEDTENAGSLEFPNELITLTEENDTLTIKYLYSNTGDKHYIASMDFESVINNTNMIVKYGIKNSQTGVIDYSTDRYAVVVPAHSTNKEYYIQISIDDKAYQASFSASMDWLLQGCDPQSEEYLSYESLDIQGSDGAYTASYSGGYIHSGELVYPSEINGSPVTAVSSSSTITNEQKSYIKSVTIPDSVTTIDNNAFNGYTHLEEVVFGDVAEVSAQSSTSSLTTIGEYAFANCVRLENLTLPSGVTSVGKNVFENCYNLKQFTIPNGVTTLTDAMFKNCSSLTSVEIPENIVDFPEEIFSGCSELVGFVIPEKIETIGVSAFKDCNRLPGEVDLTFATSVGESAFEGCSGLTKVTIGENITTLGNNTFANCGNVEEFYVLSHEAITTLSDVDVFKNINEDCKIFVIETLMNNYSADANWSTYEDHFDEIGFTTTGECIDSIEAPVLGMRIYGNSVQNGTPTPDAPVEIESVGDKTANLFDLDILETSYYEIKNNKVTIISGNTLAWANLNSLNLKPNTQYCLSVENQSKIDIRTPANVKLFNQTLTNKAVFTTDATGLVCFKFFGDVYPHVVGYIQLEEGSLATEYEPYGKYKIPVKISDVKNKFDVKGYVENAKILGAGSSIELIENGISQSQIAYQENYSLFDLNLLENTVYTFTANVNWVNYINTEARTGFKFYYSNGSVGSVNVYPSDTKICYTSLANKTLVGISSVGWSNSGLVEFTNIQLEQGETATEYVPYQKQITNIYLDEPLRKVGDIADYIDLKTGKVVRNIKKGEITSNSSFAKFNSVTNYSAFYMNVSEQIPYLQLNKINYPILSNKFTYHAANGGNANSYWTDAYQISPSLAATYNRIIFSLPNTLTSVADAKTWLEDNPVEFIYALATPIEETIEVSEFEFVTVNGETTFEVLTSVQPSQIMVKYHK